MVLCLHIGAGNPAPHASMETPIEAWITTMPMSISTGAADWLNLAALQQYPTLKIALSEGGIGRSEEHTSELQSLMRISYAVFCLKKKHTLRHRRAHIAKLT